MLSPRVSVTTKPTFITYDVPKEYVIHKPLGSGAYGHVCSATHMPSGYDVAIKKIGAIDRRLVCVRTLREMRLLRHFHHENIIAILDVIKPRDFASFCEVYLVQELMPTDLHRVLATQTLSDEHCRYFMYQLLRGLKAIHSAGILHRDLKPANLLVDEHCNLKICDFGLARDDQGLGMTEYVATRWYRAPEIMLSFRRYTKAVDLWSAGCILVEILSGKPLFPGKHYCDQLRRVFDVIGTPSEEDIKTIKPPAARQYLRSLPYRSAESIRSWKTRLPTASDGAFNLLGRLLVFDPQRRVTAAEALEHPYVAEYHDPDDEPVAPLMLEEFLSPATSADSDLKRMLYDEVMQA